MKDDFNYDWYVRNDPFGVLFERDYPKDRYPFQVGDKVWIKSINGGGCDEEDVRMIRNKQEVEEIKPLLGNNRALWYITLKGCKYMFQETNLEKA